MEKEKIFNTVSKRYLQIDGQQYKKLLRDGYTVVDNQLMPPSQSIVKSSKQVNFTKSPVKSTKSTKIDYSLTSLPDEIILEQLLLRMNLQEIMNICSINSNFNTLCHNNQFWRKMINKYYDNEGEQYLTSNRINNSYYELYKLHYLYSQLNKDFNLTLSFNEWYNKTKFKYTFKDLKVIPLSLFNLTQLEKLDLGDNKINKIPKEIKNLVNLQKLNLWNNVITTIPSEIGELTSLIYLNFYHNKIKKVPEELYNLTNLHLLGLSNNQLDYISPNIRQLIELRTLGLEYNKLISLPDELIYLNKLFTLGLSHNKLTALPDQIGYLTKLRELNISYNEITKLPDSIENLKLINFKYDHNPLKIKLKSQNVKSKK